MWIDIWISLDWYPQAVGVGHQKFGSTPPLRVVTGAFQSLHGWKRVSVEHLEIQLFQTPLPNLTAGLEDGLGCSELQTERSETSRLARWRRPWWGHALYHTNHLFDYTLACFNLYINTFHLLLKKLQSGMERHFLWTAWVDVERTRRP